MGIDDNVDLLHLCLATHLIGYQTLLESFQELLQDPSQLTNLHSTENYGGSNTTTSRQHHAVACSTQQDADTPLLTRYWESPLLLPIDPRKLTLVDGTGTCSSNEQVLVLSVTFQFFLSACSSEDDAGVAPGQEEVDIEGGVCSDARRHSRIEVTFGSLSSRGVYRTMSHPMTVSDWRLHWVDDLAVDWDQSTPQSLAKHMAQALQQLSTSSSVKDCRPNNTTIAIESEAPSQLDLHSSNSAHYDGNNNLSCYMRLPYPVLQQSARLYWHRNTLQHSSDTSTLSLSDQFQVREQKLDPHAFEMELRSRSRCENRSESIVLASEEEFQQICNVWKDVKQRFSDREKLKKVVNHSSATLPEHPVRDNDRSQTSWQLPRPISGLYSSSSLPSATSSSKLQRALFQQSRPILRRKKAKFAG